MNKTDTKLTFKETTMGSGASSCRVLALFPIYA